MQGDNIIVVMLAIVMTVFVRLIDPHFNTL
jgi:hypothetical protein